jgi:galactitol-specific phosphotransferase system IIC component
LFKLKNAIIIGSFTQVAATTGITLIIMQLVGLGFIESLNEENLQTVLNKMTETLELDLSIREIKELENNLAFETIKIE